MTQLQSPTVISSTVFSNNTDHDQTSTVTLKGKYTNTYTMETQESIMAGVSVEFDAGIPLIADGKVTVSASSTTTLSWTKTNTDTIEWDEALTVFCPSKNKVKAAGSASQGKATVPYTATWASVKNPFTILTTTGKYTGVNWWGFQIEYDAVQ